MAKAKQLKVFVCPFCTSQQYFNSIEDIEAHLYKNHLREGLHLVAQGCIKQISKTVERWHIV